MLLALSEAAWTAGGVVAAAFVAQTGLIVAALINTRRVKNHIGTPNGKGNVVEMQTAILDWIGHHEVEHARLRHACPLFDYSKEEAPDARG